MQKGCKIQRNVSTTKFFTLRSLFLWEDKFGLAPLQKCVGDFAVQILEDFAWDFRGFFPTKEIKQPATKTHEKCGGSKRKLHEASVLPKTDPNKFRTGAV